MPGSNDFSAFYLQVLSFMKFIMTSKFYITAWWCSLHPVELYEEGLDLFSNSQATSMALAGAVVQNMLQVFRRETGLDAVAWALDLSDVEILSIVRSRLGIEVPSWSPLSLTVRTHPIKHSLDLFPLGSESTKLQLQGQLPTLRSWGVRW